MLLRVAVNIILKHSDDILRCQSVAEILDVFREIPTSPHVTRCHQFIKVHITAECSCHCQQVSIQGFHASRKLFQSP